MLVTEEQRKQQQVKQGSRNTMQGLRRGGLGGDRPERDWGDGVRQRGRIWSERWWLEAPAQAELSEAMARGAPVDRERENRER